jgi:hypothetical protein
MLLQLYGRLVPFLFNNKNIFLFVSWSIFHIKTHFLLLLSLSASPGLPDDIFSNKNPNLGKFWRALKYKMLQYFMAFGILYGLVEYSTALWNIHNTALWNILRPFGIYYSHLGLFMTILLIKWFIGIFLSVLVYFINKNLATLVVTCIRSHSRMLWLQPLWRSLSSYDLVAKLFLAQHLKWKKENELIQHKKTFTTFTTRVVTKKFTFLSLLYVHMYIHICRYNISNTRPTIAGCKACAVKTCAFV